MAEWTAWDCMDGVGWAAAAEELGLREAAEETTATGHVECIQLFGVASYRGLPTPHHLLLSAHRATPNGGPN